MTTPDKKPRRSEAEIVSDYSYTYADSVLFQQYGYSYQKWMQNTGYKLVRGTTCRK